LGHLLIDVEMATAECECMINTNHPRTVDLWYPWHAGQATANAQLLRMWRRSLHVLPAILLEGAAHVNGLVPGGNAHKVPYRKGHGRLNNFHDVHGALRRTQPHLSFTVEERKESVDALWRLGIDDSARVVCVHVRTARYLTTRMGSTNSASHDFRDADIGGYRTAILWLADEGYTVVRMGTEVEEPLGIEHSNVVDYATSGGRTELLDLYLPSIAEFFVGVLSGPSHVAQLFRRPLLLTNLIPVSRMMLSMDDFMFIPKRVVSSDGEPLPLRELVRSGVFEFDDSSQYTEHGLVVVDNTSEELTEACREMAMRRQGIWVDDAADVAAQERFLSMLPGYLLEGRGSGRIASSYLRSNQWFIDTPRA
jgi:putative glycosyltransferase (TIGR04372 family)